jgi:hypothetical protein
MRSSFVIGSIPAEVRTMSDLPPRLGDLIDDYCPRCRLLLNHAIASMVGNQVAKVICQTCLSEHAYMDGKEAKKKKTPRETLFDQVLAKAAPVTSADPPAAEKKKPGVEARYITRHKSKPPRNKR